MNQPSQPRKIRNWICHKLECFADYIEAYTSMMGKNQCYYLELYAGCGNCVCVGTDCVIEDSALRALKAKTKFDRCIFIVGDAGDAKSLKKLTASYDSANIISGNPVSDKVLRQVFDIIPRSASSLALIDPQGYRKLRWSTIKKLATHSKDWRGHKIELLIIFPLEMALLRNLNRPDCRASITRLYGNKKWEEVREKRLEGKIRLNKARKQLVELYKDGLKDLGYRHVTDFKPNYLSKPPLYHVISASDSEGRARMLAEAWGKERYLPCELLYTGKKR
jgi:three-Cys-motif partner protein